VHTPSSVDATPFAYHRAVSTTIARDEVLRALDCVKCRALVERETSGDAEDLGEVLALAGATEEGLTRQMGATFEGATHRSCAVCSRSIALRGSTLNIDLLRPAAPRLDCPRCASFIDACGGPLLPPQRGLVRVRAPAEETARAYGHGRLVLDDFRCDTCARVVRASVVRGAREVAITLLAFDGPLGGPAPGPRMLLAEADASIDCVRCSGFVREVAPAGLFLADDGRTLAFAGGSHALLVAHFGGDSADHDRTCPDCSRQTCLETDVSSRRARNGPGRMEIQPGGIGPLADGCQTCAPIVLQAVAGARHLILSPDTRRSFPGSEVHVWLPLAVWDSIQARFHVGKSGKVARCDECGRGAQFVAYWQWPVELGLRARPGAARSQRPRLDCERCEGFVASEEFPEVKGAVIEMRALPEPIYGSPESHALGRHSVSRWTCADCARPIVCEDDGHGWIVKVALSRP